MEKTPQKADSPPLLAAGFHTMKLEEIHALTVKKFPNSKRRQPLFDSFVIYTTLLERTGINFKLWIDGSFTTEKNEPNDIDIVIIFDQAQVDSLSENSINELLKLADHDKIKARFNLDVYFEKSDNTYTKAYWRGLFGFLRDEETPKGLITLEINNG